MPPIRFFFRFSSSNYLALSMPTLGLRVNFFSKVLYALYYSLLGNLRYPLLAYYLVILLLNAI